MDRGIETCRQERSLRLALTLSTTLLLAACNDDGSTSTSDRFALQSVSSRPDLVTGGDVVVKVVLPPSVAVADARVQLNGADVTGQLVFDPTLRTLTGRVGGLTSGASSPDGSPNVITASSTKDDSHSASLQLVNYPITGPVLSGPHKTPYECRTIESGLGAPLDADCSAAKQVLYYYKATDGSFKSLSDPVSRPLDLVNTTTNAGATVPYIVRVEGGTNNRTIYRIAILDNPTPASVANATYVRTVGWNGKVVVNFGGGCGNQYNQGRYTAPEALDDASLAPGFAYVVSSELYNQLHCNPHLQGEALMMLKEYFIKNYGLPKWVVGTGSSGGAIQQYLIAQLYPGLLDGIEPGLSFPDSQLEDVNGCALMKKNVYPRNVSRWTPAKQLAAEAYSAGACQVWVDIYNFGNYPDSIVGISSPNLAPFQAGNIPCGLNDQSKKYDPVTNPGGARCDGYTANVNLLTTGADGLVRRPFDNVGVQYGLQALNSGTLSVDDFLELNENIGGYDQAGRPAGNRSTADPVAIRNAYRGGLKNSFMGGLSTTPILTIRANGSGAGDIHARLNDFIVRQRLAAANGTFANQVILTTGPAASTAARLNINAYAMDLMNRWLDAIAADPAPSSVGKTNRLKPVDAIDTCWDVDGTRFAEVAGPGANRCNAIYPVASSPILNAGAPLGTDVFKCQLKPIAATDYTTTFSPTQQTRLATIFPSGVCDWTKPDAGKLPLQGTFLKLPLT